MNIPLFDTSRSGMEGSVAALETRRAAAQGLSPENNDINTNVAGIIGDVARRGDAALLEYTERFDGVSLAPERIQVSAEEIHSALSSLSPRLTEALKTSAERIREFQKTILHSDPAPLKTAGRSVSLRYRPVEAAGLCVPGASASLASSVLMNVIPAVAAGVRRIVMITPPGSKGFVSPDRLAAAHIAGVDEIYRIFGAQGIAAIAYGTESIKPVDFIAGPGNIFVATAKRAVFGKVGVDMIAGPSEVAVLADGTSNPVFIAAELLAQAEHTDGSATLITDSARVAEDTDREIARQLAQLHRRRNPIKKCLEDYGAIVLCGTFDECIGICNRMAPEHLVIMSEKAEDIAHATQHAGAIFLGHHTPVAVGDYIAGPSHTLPTGTTARFTGGLTANHFLKSSSIVQYEQKALKADAEAICMLAESEGLSAHAQSVRRRLGGPEGGQSSKSESTS